MGLKKSWKYLVIFLIGGIAAGFFTSRYFAIQHAVQACALPHLTQLEAPFNTQATPYLSRDSVKNYPTLTNVVWPNLPVWHVSMQGTWTVSGPSAEEGQPESVPMFFHTCEAVVGAFSTQVMSTHAE